MSLFITTLESDPLFFFSVVLTVVVAITLHELAHGIAAIKHGDQTPIHSGHMTLNPLVHMGPFSLIVLAVAGIAWGTMPIDPTRMRGKYAEAVVAAAGPAMNLLLGLLGMAVLIVLVKMWDPSIVLGQVLQRQTPSTVSTTQGNTLFFVLIFSWINFVLCMFNLMPVPPLDGSHILANFNRDYRNFIYDPQRQGLALMGLFIVFFMARFFFDWSLQLAQTIYQTFV